MKRWIGILLAAALFTGCAGTGETTAPPDSSQPGETVWDSQSPPVEYDVHIALDGQNVYVENDVGVYAANDIVYYEAGHDFTYGEGEPGDEHTQQEADAHTVVHITRPGVYRLTGTLDLGQIAVDLGKEAEDDPSAVVTLILDGVDITCTVAPAVIFYNVYECGDKDEEKAGPVVDTSAAGANVILADGSVNRISGSYVARIYKPGSVELSEDGTEVEEAKKLHKYDGAFYSKMSMNVSGGPVGDGILEITAENEGLDSELHLAIHGGDIRIVSGNDGINTNEDNISVTTIHGGKLSIRVDGGTGEGDGIDSNGYLVINGGQVTAYACARSADAGIDSDCGIYLNGGTVVATGNMLDRISQSEAAYVTLQFAQAQPGGQTYTLKNEAGEAVFACTPENGFTQLVLSDPALAPGNYTLWLGDTQLSGTQGGGFGGPGGFPGGGSFGGAGEPPEGPPEGFGHGEPPEGFGPGGQPPEGMEMPTLPEGETMPTRPEGGFHGDREDRPQGGFGGAEGSGTASTTFSITQGANQFGAVGPA